MIRFLVVVTAFAVAAIPRLASATDGEACVTEDPEELTPATVPDIERAAYQDVACSELLNGFPGNIDANAWNNCRADLNAAKAFCANPLGATVVSPEELADAHREVKDGTCTPDESTITVQASGGALGLGTPFQDDLLRGLAAFIVSRAKAEAMAWAIDEIGKKICADKDAAALLPNSCQLMNEASPSSGTPMAWGTLKTAFETDLEKFPERAMSCVADEAGLGDDAKHLLGTGVQVTKLVREGEDPLAVLYGLTDRYPFDKDDKCTDPASLDCGLHMLGYVAGVLTPSAKADGSIRPILDEERFVKIAARRVWDHAGVIGLPTGDLATKGKELGKHLRKLYGQILRIADKIKRARDALDKVGEDADRFQSVVRLARAVVDLIDAALDLVPDDYQTGLPATKQTAAKILDVLDEIAAALDAAVEREYARTFVHVSAAVRLVVEVDADAKLPAVITKYGPFVAEVAAAKTPEDVQRALETAAAPIGGSLAKRGKGKRTVAINAFFGLHAGREVVDGLGPERIEGKHAGLYAAVGVEASMGVGKNCSLGLFLSVIDLGALTSLHIDDESEEAADDEPEVETTPEVGFKQVFSPGLYLVGSFQRGSVGVGASLTPKLRNVSEDGMFVEEASAIRYGVFLALDITIFPF
jgi:hypothetical protein